MRLGLDYGGTKIEGIVLGSDGTERARARVPTPRHDYDGGIRAIRGLMESLEAAAGGARRERRHRGAGLGRPRDRHRQQGQLDLAARPRPARRPRERAGSAGEDRQRRQLLRALRGGGRRRRRRAGGLRGDPRLGGRRRHRRARSASSRGRTPSAASGGTCRCRRRRTTSAPGRAAPAASSATPRPGCRGGASRPTTRGCKGMPVEDAPRAEELVAMAAAGNADAEATLRRYEDRLGRSLAMIVNILDPDVIVLGGGMSNVERLYQTVPELIAAARLRRQVQHAAGAEPARRQLGGAGGGLALMPAPFRLLSRTAGDKPPACRAIAQSGSAFDWGSKGREFESR